MASIEEIADTLRLLDDLDAHKKYNKLAYFKPYPYQENLFKLGGQFRERFFQAGNRVGKSEGGAVEAAYHATGQYPKDWKGKVFDHPVKVWVAGKRAIDVRDVCQTKLCGQFGLISLHGTGFIPQHCFIDKPLRSHGVTDAYDTVHVKHFFRGIENGVSTISFKSYDAGKETFTGEDVDFGWCDEPPPMDVFGEFIVRINSAGRMLITATPLSYKWLGDRFKGDHIDRTTLHACLDDIPGITEEEIKQKLESYLPHERDARRKGTFLMGEGHVFTIEESAFKIAPFEIPDHWPLAWAIDFGIGHAFAAVLLAWDRDTDTVYVIRVLKMKGASALQHAAAMMTVCAEAPVIWPHDGNVREKGSGEPLASIYRGFGLNMGGTHAQFETGGYQFEAGISLWYKRLMMGTFKVFNICTDFFEEYRYYSRKTDGTVDKTDDDVLSAVRIGLMNIRAARISHMGGQFGRQRPPDRHDEDLMRKPYDPWGAARDDEYNPFAPREEDY